MKVIYITAYSPWGKGETFILQEMLELIGKGVDLVVIPRNPPKSQFHQESQGLLDHAVWLPLIGAGILKTLLGTMLSQSKAWKVLWNVLANSRSPGIAVKNLAVFPKGIFVSHLLGRGQGQHLHAHWGSTTSTMAYIVSQMTGIPWSFTLHRWDIKEDNMLCEKLRAAQFVRCISRHGQNELVHIVGDQWKNKMHVIHMGVAVPEVNAGANTGSGVFTIIMPANLVGVKGHRYLIDACSLLINSGNREFHCTFYGEGPLRTELQGLIDERGLGSYIEMPGAIAHEKLLAMYRDKMVDLVVLPSIQTRGGEHEGIPVALMEAMSFGIPVISTNTGAISELLYDGAGVMCNEEDAGALADEINHVMNNPGFVQELKSKGYSRIKDEFNVEKTASQLMALM